MAVVAAVDRKLWGFHPQGLANTVWALATLGEGPSHRGCRHPPAPFGRGGHPEAKSRGNVGQMPPGIQKEHPPPLRDAIRPRAVAAGADGRGFN